MFDSVLNRAHVPKRQLGTGAAFAVAFHLWLVIAMIWLWKGDHQDKKEAVDVTFVAALPPPPPPPPPPPERNVADWGVTLAAIDSSAMLPPPP